MLDGGLAETLMSAGVTQRNRRRIPSADAWVVGEDRPHGLICLLDPHYPAALRQIPDPPLVLYYEGRWQTATEPCVAIVGARNCTAIGRQTAQRFAADLVRYGVGVVSGLALGIDGAAHQGALSGARQHARGTAIVCANTVAVLGSGFRHPYPRQHLRLRRQIVAEGGVLLTEYAPHELPLPHHFPARNRIISGISMATVVVEAAERSGSLITADLAAEQGRDVFAVPGPLANAVSRGCHRLIQQGAGLVTGAEDVLLALGGISLEAFEQELQRSAGLASAAADNPAVPVRKQTLLPASCQVLLDEHIHGYPTSFDELQQSSLLDVPELARCLVQLELYGFVQLGPLGYSRALEK